MRYLFLIIVIMVGWSASASQPDSLKRTFNTWNSLKRQHDNINQYNPAGRRAYFADRFVSSQAGAQLLNTNQLSILEQGTRLTTYGLHFEGYQTLGSSVLWGQASYSNVYQEDVRFNNVADFGFLYPYIIADSIGGDRKLETYTLKGGFQKQTTHLTYGIEAHYRATISNGNTDPRPLNTVSDLTIKAGVSKAIARHQLGAFAQYGSYSQELKVNSMADNRNDYIYLLRGFGLQQNRISGPYQSYNNNYFAITLGGGLTLSPDASGFSALLLLTSDDIHLKESNTNNGIVPFKLTNQQLEAELGYRLAGYQTSIHAKIGMERYKKIGTERIYSTDNTELLSESKPFNHTLTNYKANALLSIQKENLTTFEVFGQLSYSITDAFHLGDNSGSYFTNISSLNPFVQYQWNHYWKSSSLTIRQDISGRYVVNANASLNNDGTALSEGVRENYNRLKQNLFQSTLSVNYTVFTPKKSAWSIAPAVVVMSNANQTNWGGNLSLIHNF
ncbi:hypothetical protein KEM09_03285 [Carboxylicivirga mesophila]|uniref:DUF6850 domain-containing protein n=1 Tax=Carboxylicivirga mesophila TaxID=1166478 RepID=A0ABS5K605_9BACT|nr:DUF6850 family outer membrane beta-barrel protein [Carboxylicivirga mesophila]MBS2210405.1 hypothetical protein [Carboxylicivirga mesophila]